jgi:site-specific recombinase XerD
LAQPDATTVAGARDRALLLLLYNTGARISEALAVCQQDVTFSRPHQVRLHGKGGKDRLCPLWSETVSAIRNLLARSPAQAGPIFRNSQGGGLSRDGAAYLLSRSVRSAAQTLPILRQRRVTPHALRHSCAVALLQAGVDLTVIRDYLGHVSVATTGRYVSSNLEMKRTVLEAFWKRSGLQSARPTRRWRPTDNALAFLASL